MPDRRSEVMQYYNDLIEANPNDPQAYFERGREHSLNENYDAAGLDFDEAVRLDPTQPWYFLQRAANHLIELRHEESIADYTQALRLAPDDPKLAAEVYSSRASQYRWLENFEAAIADYTARMEISPQYRSHDLINRAAMRRLNGDLQGAMTDASEVIVSEPNNCLALVFRALCRSEQGDFAGSEADYTEAMRLNPDYKAYYLRLRAAVKTKRGDHTGATDDENAAMELTPEDKRLPFNYDRSEAALKQGLFDEALQHIEPLIQKYPEDFHYRILRGDIFQAQGNTAAAVEDYALAIQKLNEVITEPEKLELVRAGYLIDLFVIRGHAHAGIGNVQAAIMDYQKALAINEKFSSLQLDTHPLRQYIDDNQGETS